MDQSRRAAVYVRISKDREGRELGVERQEQDCRKLAKRLDYEVTLFKDNDVSASTLSTKVRPEFDDMMRRVEAGEFTAIVAYSNSRLTRRVVELSRLIDVARKTGVRVHTVVSGQHNLDTADGRATMLTIATWDQAEAERTSERIKRQKQQRAEAGQWHGGQAPFGYRTEDGTLVPEPSEVNLIEEAARRLLQDREPLGSIVSDWNSPRSEDDRAPKHSTRAGKHWRQANLRSLLMNRSLLGETKVGVKGWEPVLDQRTFDRLQALFNDPARKVTHSPGVKSAKYTMGGGLAVCGKCGKPLVASMKRETMGRAQVTVGCLRRVNGPDPEAHPMVQRERDGKWVDTGRVAIDHHALERYVFSEVVTRLEATPRWHQRMAEQDPGVNASIDALEAERAGLHEQRERAGKAFVLGVMSEREVQREVERVDAQLDDIAKQLDSMLIAPMLSEVLANGLDWQAWAPGRRRTFLRLFIDRVIVNGWPEGEARTTFRKRGETHEQFAGRQRDRMQAITAKRVQIVWKWES